MSISKKLIEWQQAHLLSADQVATIQAYEDAQPSAIKFLWRNGLLGLGLLAIGIGMAAIVASNWNAIPTTVKLSLHIILNLIAIGGLFHLWQKGEAKEWRFEALLVIQATLVLTLMALLGQILHTQSPIEKTMLVWWSLITPMLLWFGRFQISLLLWTFLSLFVLFGNTNLNTEPLFIFSTLIAATQLYILLPHFQTWRDYKGVWNVHGRKIGLAVLIITANILLIYPWGYWHTSHYNDTYWPYTNLAAKNSYALYGWEIALSLNLILTYVLSALQHKTLSLIKLVEKSDTLTRIVFAHLMMALFLSFVPVWFGWFILYWFSVGYVGLRHDDRRIVGLSITALAIRIIVLYFHLTQSLMTTGILMIISGASVLYLVKTYPRWRAVILNVTGAKP